jgi:hypothetical protein
MKPDYLEHAMRDCGRVELRHQTPEGWVSGVFDDLHALRSTVAGLAPYGNQFITINGLRLMRATNDMDGQAVRDADVAFLIRLVFDFDPRRPTGTASTDVELAAAVAQRNRFVQAMAAMGWPMPATAMSGNGAHALYRWRVPVSAEFKEMLAVLYRGMESEFSTELVHFDPTVRNPARIWRLYGTINRKGTPTPERPHRMATVAVPDRWRAVAPQQVERLASAYARRAPAPAPHVQGGRPGGHSRVGGRGSYATLDVRGWFAAHSAYKRALGGGKHAVLCPWVGEHSTESGPMDTSTVVWDAAGGAWPSFHCSHAHCDGRNIRDVLARWGDADAWCASEWQRAAP